MNETSNETPLPTWLRSFAISSLLGEKDVAIEFDSDVTVFLADNGTGKTTILGVIYAVLSRQLHRLRKIEFKSIAVEFSNGAKIEIPSSILQPELDLSRLEPRLRRFLHRLPESALYHLLDQTRGLSLSEFRRHPLVDEMRVLERSV